MSKYRSTWHLLPEQTYAFDYDFTLSMPSYKVTGDGDSFKEYVEKEIDVLYEKLF